MRWKENYQRQTVQIKKTKHFYMNATLIKVQTHYLLLKIAKNEIYVPVVPRYYLLDTCDKGIFLREIFVFESDCNLFLQIYV